MHSWFSIPIHNGVAVWNTLHYVIKRGWYINSYYSCHTANNDDSTERKKCKGKPRSRQDTNNTVSKISSFSHIEHNFETTKLVFFRQIAASHCKVEMIHN